MKTILIDLYKVKDLYSGLGQFSLNYASELIRVAPEDLDLVFLIPKNFKFDAEKKAKTIKVSFQKRYLPSLTKPYDIWHSLNQFPSHLPGRSSVFILTVHDLNFLIEKNEARKGWYLKTLQRNINRADYITAISEFTKQTITDNVNLRGKSITTIYNGVEINTIEPGHKPKYLEDKKFFFSIGIFSRKKNFHTLLPVMNYFKDYQLIIAGNSDTVYGKEVQKQITDMGLTSKVILPGKINDSERLWLYRNCEAFLFPSMAEGFGMPVIEAMKFGKPVFLSKYTSLPEIGGDSAFYFDNFNEEHMSSYIKSKLTIYNDNKIILSGQIKKHAERFSWEASVARYLKLYYEIVNRNLDPLTL
jgi:glycosyltransferase involved in cell wall biosynthesis